MSSSWGKHLKLSIFGQSHSDSIGVVAEGLPCGFSPDIPRLQAFMQRRSPGNNDFSTKRKEADNFEILSGINDGAFCGAPFAAIIKNSNTRSKDYTQFADIPRPGHADFTAQMKFHGYQDIAGGGHFSGRLTAPLCIIGGLCLQILEAKGIYIAAHITQIGSVKDERFNAVDLTCESFEKLSGQTFPTLMPKAGEAMAAEVLKAKEDGDSIGGIIECAAIGLPAGLGFPMFDGMENLISSIIFGIPAIKGIDFGAGFDVANLRGSENNDCYTIKDGNVTTVTNNHGGILGGITSGMPLIFRVAVKPTPSIFKTQQSISLSEMKETELKIQGRHDPCIVPRALPCIEAAAAIAIYDALLEAKNSEK